MSYDQTFKGQFEYADAHCLEAGLDRFAAMLEDSIVDLDTLEMDGLTITIDMDCSAPASMYEETTGALRELGSEAKAGSVIATFTMDGTERERIPAVVARAATVWRRSITVGSCSSLRRLATRAACVRWPSAASRWIAASMVTTATRRCTSRPRLARPRL